MSDDPKVSQRYRDLPREEPPRALDDAILAASRRAVEARPAPLVVPTGRRRWYFPVAAAAVIVLAVAVVAHVEREQPDTEILTPSTTVLETPPAPAAQEPKVEEPKEAPRQLRKQASPGFTPDPRADSAASAPAAPAPAAPPAAQAERSEAMGAVAGARESSRDERKNAQMARSSVSPTPEGELERIARLRAAGKHEEADKALAEFRKTFPAYKISEAMRAKVERPQ